MNRLSIVGGICALLLLGTAVTVVAQDEHKNDRPPAAQPENRKDDARPADRRNQEPQSGNRHETTPQNEGRPEQQPQSGDRHPQQQEDERRMQHPQNRNSDDRRNMERPNVERPQEREQERREQPRSDQARPEGGERGRAERPRENQRRIPEHDFRAHFGREHRFAPGRMQVYEGRPQFHYSGYVFEIFEPWPADWVYDEDDYYIDYVDDEYWLYSFRHPGMRLELIIVE